MAVLSHPRPLNCNYIVAGESGERILSPSLMEKKYHSSDWKIKTNICYYTTKEISPPAFARNIHLIQLSLFQQVM